MVEMNLMERNQSLEQLEDISQSFVLGFFYKIF